MPVIKIAEAAPDAYDDIASWTGAYRSDKAKPCPFCGYAPMIVKWHGGGPGKRRIMCRSDYCYVQPAATGATEKAAVTHWNQRPG